MAKGGTRPGAGRKKGSKLPQTLEKQIVLDALRQRVMRHADDLFHAQFSLAKGSVQVFRVDEEERDGKIKRIHTLVTDTDEIKRVLDEHEGGNGTVDDAYYFVNQISPDNRAIDSLIDRAFGKAAQSVDVTSNGEDLFKQVTVKIIDGNDNRNK